MLKPETIDIEDSNIANYGSQEHKDLRQSAAESEKEWRGCGQAPGVEIWRIENFGIKRWPEKMYGTFYQGDSYIVLYTYKNKESKKLHYNVHFWLGRETTQDEYGTAAYKTVELDDLLGDIPVQFREVQGHESPEFRKLFKKYTILKGGVDSAFNNVKPTEYQPRLLHVKGRNHVMVVQVALSARSLNDGDCFVLDAGLNLYQWNGTSSNHFERRKAMEVINTIKEERNGKPVHKVLDGLEADKAFWDILGGMPDQVAPATPDKNIFPPQKKLFRLSDASGKMKLTKEAEGELKIDMLDSKDVFIVDFGVNIYAWVGSGASKDERGRALEYATGYLKKTDRPMATPIVRIMDGAEPPSFRKALDAAPVDTSSGKHAGTVSLQGGADEKKESLPTYFGVLQVTAAEAKGLKDTQKLGKQDPYCSIRVGKQKWRTRPHPDGNDIASWNEEWRVGLTNRDDEVQIRFTVKNENLIFDNEIGSVTKPLSRFCKSGSGSDWFELLDDEQQPAGQLKLSWKFIPAAKIRVDACRQLHDKQSLGKQDPFVKLKLHSEKYKTEVAEDMGISPKWTKDNVFQFNIALDDDAIMELEVLNHNLLKNDTIAVGVIPAAALRQLVKGQSKWFNLKTTHNDEEAKFAGEISLTLV